MWRIGRLARLAGVSERTLRHYDRIGLLSPAAVDGVTGYRWYGTAELVRLDRIRGLQHLGLSLRLIAETIDAPDSHLAQALGETVATLHRDIAALSAVAARAEEYLTTPAPILPQQTTVPARRLRVRHLTVAHPAELADHCAADAAVLLTWLRGRPSGEFTAALTTARGGRWLALPARTAVRVVVPPGTGVVDAGRYLFDWLHHRGLTVCGPTLEEHLVDDDGDRATVLEVPVQAGPTPPSTALPLRAIPS
ncbi:MerR family transcriptional regulator [Rhizohabitans arisaemae]|uniref:MerR family transcriptional regulator n=1 Tax=Rhizohabitans arisaemae TaxID=2720610 RepID=UPI0024B1BEC3|nr:MerR family transcriptional regulator [Rhizohabitans arisaemae]